MKKCKQHLCFQKETEVYKMDPRDEYEFYDEWLNRSEEEHDIGLEDYNDMRCIEEYGEEKYFDEDDDSDDPYYEED